MIHSAGMVAVDDFLCHFFSQYSFLGPVQWFPLRHVRLGQW